MSRYELGAPLARITACWHCREAIASAGEGRRASDLDSAWGAVIEMPAKLLRCLGAATAAPIAWHALRVRTLAPPRMQSIYASP